MSLYNAVVEKDLIMLQTLLTAKADPNEPHHCQQTALHQAASRDRVDTAVTLLDHKANPNAVDCVSWTPLHMATSTKMIKLLLEHRALVNMKNKHGSTPLHFGSHFAFLQEPDTLELLLEAKADINATNDDGDTPLTQAAYWDASLKITQLLVKYKADTNAVNKSRYTPLLYYSSRHDSALVTKLLLENKALINAKNLDGLTPLHFAADCGCVETTKILLQCKADVEQGCNVGRTALCRTIISNKATTMNLLLDHKASVNVRDEDGNTPLHLAMYFYPSCAETLLNYGAIVQAQTKSGITPIKWVGENSETGYLLSRFEWQQSIMEFCKGLDSRLGQHSPIRRAFTSDLSERYLIWMIGLFLKPSK